MKYAKGFKFRIYPNAEQQKIINQTLGCARFVYNHFLAIRRDNWQEKHESVTYVKSSRMLTELKCHPDFVWLKSVDSMALQEALRNLDRAFQNFFKKQSGYPKFKSSTATISPIVPETSQAVFVSLMAISSFQELV